MKDGNHMSIMSIISTIYLSLGTLFTILCLSGAKKGYITDCVKITHKVSRHASRRRDKVVPFVVTLKYILLLIKYRCHDIKGVRNCVLWEKKRVRSSSPSKCVIFTHFLSPYAQSFFLYIHMCFYVVTGRDKPKMDINLNIFNIIGVTTSVTTHSKVSRDMS